MNARVRRDSRLHVVTACSGIDFSQARWSPVPPGMEEEARNNPYLETDVSDAPVVGEAPVLGVSTEESLSVQDPTPPPQSHEELVPVVEELLDTTTKKRPARKAK